MAAEAYSLDTELHPDGSGRPILTEKINGSRIPHADMAFPPAHGQNHYTVGDIILVKKIRIVDAAKEIATFDGVLGEKKLAKYIVEFLLMEKTIGVGWMITGIEMAKDADDTGYVSRQRILFIGKGHLVSMYPPVTGQPVKSMSYHLSKRGSLHDAFIFHRLRRSVELTRMLGPAIAQLAIAVVSFGSGNIVKFLLDRSRNHLRGTVGRFVISRLVEDSLTHVIADASRTFVVEFVIAAFEQAALEEIESAANSQSEPKDSIVIQVGITSGVEAMINAVLGHAGMFIDKKMAEALGETTGWIGKAKTYFVVRLVALFTTKPFQVIVEKLSEAYLDYQKSEFDGQFNEYLDPQLLNVFQEIVLQELHGMWREFFRVTAEDFDI